VSRQHAVIEKRAINLDNGGQPLVCCWDECDRLGSTLYRHVSCLHDTRAGCASSDERVVVHSGRTAHLVYVFCSQRHRNYWVNSTGRNALESMARTGRAYGNLPAGLRGMIG
jgi:hypothetical protein